MRSAPHLWSFVRQTLLALGLCVLLGLWGCAVPLSASNSALSLSTLPPRLTLAYAYYQNGQYRVALEESQKVQEAHPELPQAMSLQGLIFARLNETALAHRSFHRAEQAALQDPDIAHNYGLFLCEQQQFPASFERFRRALQQPLYTDKAKTLWVWGVCAQQSGDELGAQSLWAQSLGMAPIAPAALSLAQSYQQQNLTQRAQAVLATFNSTAAATPETLWLGIRLARQMADETTVQRYAWKLQKQFPTSSQWNAFQHEAFDE